MATVVSVNWWKACEVPLAETEWKNIKLYCNRELPAHVKGIYFIRLAPPFMIRYGSDEEFDTPLIYVGCGKDVKMCWDRHRRNWLPGLGGWLPGGRYEFWGFEHKDYKNIEQDALFKFKDEYGRLPLANRNGGSDKNLSYNEAFHEVVKGDSRYWWAISPIQPIVREYLKTGELEADEDDEA